MILKEAAFTLTNINPFSDKQENDQMIRTASGKVIIEPGSEKSRIVEAEIKKHPNALFFRAKAIKADEPNSNGDYFSVDELLNSYKTFEGVPFFTNHDNQNVENARGKVIFAEWIPEENAVYTICFIDRDAYPHICRSIEEEYVTGVSMGAINAGSKILMADYTCKNIEDINEGDLVLSHKMLPRKVLKTHSEYLGKDMYEIQTKTYHRSPLFTEDHPVFHISKEEIIFNKKQSLALAQKNKYERSKNYTEEFIGQDTWRTNDYNPEFKEASCLAVDDYIMIPSRYNLNTEEISDLDGIYYLYGVFLGDGYLLKNKNGEYCGVGFCLNIDEIELANRITKIVNAFIGKEVDVDLCKERNGMYLKVYDKDFANEIYRLFGSGAKNKRLKADIRTYNQASKLIAGYLDTDGCIVDKTNQNTRGNKFGEFQISSANIELLEDIQNLLIGMGYVSRISTFNREPSENSVVNISTIEHTLAIGSNAHKIFEESLKYINSGFDGNEILAGQSFITKINDVNYMACPIKNINIIKNFDEPVYDLTVEEDESYIADGMAIHNCSVEYSVCNICRNKAERTEDYCSHIRNRKGRKFSGKARDVITGEEKTFKDHPVFEYNYGLKFIELSAVVDPACESCHIEGIIPNDNYLSKVAKLENEFRMIKTAAIEKEASQEEIDQLEECLATLEQIAVNLIQNRKQVEMEFSSDLVQIMSDLQSWLEELIGAGYGSVESDGNVPGTIGNLEDEGEGITDESPAMSDQPSGPQMAPPQQGGQEITPTPVAAEEDMGEVGSVSGSPATPATSRPNLPITTPVKPRTSLDSRSIQRISDTIVERDNLLYNEEKRIAHGNQIIKNASNICDTIKKMGDKEMGSRRTISEKKMQKEQAMKILSNSWKEKQEFSEYIKLVPSIQNNECRLSVNRRDDSFIIVAEDKKSDAIQVWTYEDLTDEERDVIMESPENAAHQLLKNFANNLNNKKEGVKKMSDINKMGGATNVQSVPDQVQEGQLNRPDLYHPRQKTDTHSTTQKQLESQREGEQEVLTEVQLEKNKIKLHPRRDDAPDQVQEGQLKGNREYDEAHSVTQKQLSDNRINNEPETITEDQLNNVATPWQRAANRDSAMFKSATEHMDAILKVMASSAIKTGCTPDEVCTVASSLVDTLENRYNLGVSLFEDSKNDEDIDYAKRVAFWQNKNLRVANAGTKDIAEVVVNELRKFASDETYNPDLLIDAIDIVSEGDEGAESVSKEIEKQIEASQKQKVIKKSPKAELREALRNKVAKKDSDKASKSKRELERKKIMASVDEDESQHILNPKGIKNADTVIETSFDEIGTKQNDPNLKKDIIAFTKGALSSQNMKMASITNVTISGDTIQIAVETGTEENEVNIDSGVGTTQIPLGEDGSPMPPAMPEGDMSGEGLGETLPPEGQEMQQTEQQAWASSKKNGNMKRHAQSPMGGGMEAPGGVSAPGASEQALPGAMPSEADPVQALTTDVGDETEIPNTGERQPPWATCPECGSQDVDVSNEEGNIKGTCNACGAEYEALLKRTVEYTIIKPTKSVGEEGVEVPEAPEAPEVPALPVAAQTNLSKDSIVRISQNQEKHGHVCPACGQEHCTASTEQNGHIEFSCDNCGTSVEKDFMVNSKNPEEGVLRVAWNVFPELDDNCESCKESAKKLASDVKISKMLRTAASKSEEFPTSACMERLARKYGGDTVATFGPCKGKLMADCVCQELKKLGFRKIRHMNRMASVSMQSDPWDECIKEQTTKEGHTIKEAESICNCIKKKFASELSDNIYVQAFKDDIENGIEKDLNVTDLITLDEKLKAEKYAKVKIMKLKALAQEEKDIGTDLPPMDEITIEAEYEEVPDNSDESVESPEESNAIEVEESLNSPEEIVEAETKDEIKVEADSDNVETVEAENDTEVVEAENNTEAFEESDNDIENEDDVKKEALAMSGKRVRKTNEEVLKMASSIKKVDDIEANVEAGVPRSKATIRNEGADNIDVQTAKPNVPRANAEMGHEGADNINPSATLPTPPVNSQYIGHEKEIQKDMPAINNQIKGTAIASVADDIANKIAKAGNISKEAVLELLNKEAKKLKEVDTVADDVEAGVPRSNATMGNEGADNIDVKTEKPKVPRANAEMGNEGADNINPKADSPDVPIGNGHMGNEKEVQKDMPGINEKYLKQVKQERQMQLDKISNARKEEAIKTTAWLVANNRIDNDKETFDNVVKALMAFEADKIEHIASSMFPSKISKQASKESSKESSKDAGYGIPAIVQESSVNEDNDLQTRLANSFTIGNSKFDKDLTIYGDK